MSPLGQESGSVAGVSGRALTGPGAEVSRACGISWWLDGAGSASNSSVVGSIGLLAGGLLGTPALAGGHQPTVACLIGSLIKATQFQPVG